MAGEGGAVAAQLDTRTGEPGVATITLWFCSADGTASSGLEAGPPAAPPLQQQDTTDKARIAADLLSLSGSEIKIIDNNYRYSSCLHNSWSFLHWLSRVEFGGSVGKILAGFREYK